MKLRPMDFRHVAIDLLTGNLDGAASDSSVDSIDLNLNPPAAREVM